MPGQLIDVGGHRLHLNCTGSGSPTVVLATGRRARCRRTSGGSRRPSPVSTRVCVYDRAGRGWSEPADTPQDAAQIATDLHTLLQRGNVPGPYVLAGHSFGGLYVLTFAARYPDEVAGMVLVDSTAPASAAKPRAASPYDGGSYDVLGRVSALVSSLGSTRSGPPLRPARLRRPAAAVPGRGPRQHRDRKQSSQHDRRVRPGERLEAGSCSSRDFADKPLVVLTAGIGSDAAHSAAQDQLATLSTNSVHRVIDGAAHEALIADEEGAAATTQAILDVVQAARSHTSLG